MHKIIFALILSPILLTRSSLAEDSAGANKALLDRGRYLAIIAGCNDCHTPGYAEAAGNVPEKEWLTGVPIGWRGPWGTTYAINLRLLLSAMQEEQWIKFARASRARPPMPAYILHNMTEDDLKSIYRFVSSLGASGMPMPQYVPPEKDPETAYFDFTPKEPK